MLGKTMKCSGRMMKRGRNGEGNMETGPGNRDPMTILSALAI